MSDLDGTLVELVVLLGFVWHAEVQPRIRGRPERVTAVLPLRDAAASESGAVRRAARIALDEIQTGLTGAPGAVSLIATWNPSS